MMDQKYCSTLEMNKQTKTQPADAEQEQRRERNDEGRRQEAKILPVNDSYMTKIPHGTDTQTYGWGKNQSTRGAR